MGKQWWFGTFGCKQVALPDWDDSRPSDIAFRPVTQDDPTILLTDLDAPEPAGWPILFTDDIREARCYLNDQGVPVGEIGRRRSGAL